MPGEESTSGSPKPGYLIATENGQAENHGGRLVAGTIARGGSSVEPAGFQGRDSLGIWNGRSPRPRHQSSSLTRRPASRSHPVSLRLAPGRPDGGPSHREGSSRARRTSRRSWTEPGAEKNPHQPHFFLAIAAKCTIRQIKKFLGAARAGPGRKGVVNCTHWADTCWSNSTVVTQNR